MSGFCGQCGTARPDGARFCIECGASLGPTHCPTCGKPLPPGTVLSTSPDPVRGRSDSPTPGPAVSGPRGPSVGPDYVASRDCGNCGFALVPGAPRCNQCGSTNTGPVFDPRATGR